MKMAQLLLVAIMAGVAGGALVWWKVQPSPPPGGRADVGINHAAEPAESPPRPARASVRPRPEPTPRALRGATPDLPAPGAVAVLARPDADGKPAPAADKREDLPASNGRVVVNQTSINQFAINHRTAVSPPAAPLEKPPQPAPTGVPAGDIDDALSYALEAADPFLKQGFTIREDYWGGGLSAKGTKAIVHQLFKGNDYWFWAGTDARGAKISVHVYDGDGNLAEVEAKELKVQGGGNAFGARVVPKTTGSYYLIVSVEKAPEDVRVPWALTYGFR